jgi:hypothetical protein
VVDKFIYWYRARTSDCRFRQLVDEFAENGIVLDNPVHGCPMVLNVDGDQVPLTIDEMCKWINANISVLNIQWWLSGTADVICMFDYEPLAWEKQTYYLDGLSNREIQLVESVILGQVEEHPGETLAVVIDVHGATEDFDWDEFVRDSSARVELMPDVLLLPKGDARVENIAAVQSRYDLGDGYEVITSRRWRAQ